MKPSVAMLRVLTGLLLLLGVVVAASAQTRVVKPGDKVTLTCEEEPSLNREYTLTKDGLILLSFVGAVRVGGLTEKEAGDKIAEQLVAQKILRKATVTLRLTAPPAAPVKYSGAVTNTGETPHSETLRLSDVVRLSQPTDVADLEKVEITSAIGEKIVVNFALYQGVNDAYNPLLKPGDSIFFAIKIKPAEIFVAGGVANPGTQSFVEGLTLRKAIDAAGGFSSLGDKARVHVERAGQTLDFDLTLPSADVALQPDDRVVVEVLKERRFVFVDGQVRKPGSIEYRDGMTISMAINDAMPTGSARMDRVKLVRRGAATEEFVNVERILKGFAPDVPLLAGDNIVVQKKGIKINPLTAAAGVALFFLIVGR